MGLPYHRLSARPLTFSPREREVLTGLSQGWGTRQLADRLCLSVKTVESYYGHLRRKLVLQSVDELRVYAVYWGWYGNGRACP